MSQSAAAHQNARYPTWILGIRPTLIDVDCEFTGRSSPPARSRKGTELSSPELERGAL